MVLVHGATHLYGQRGRVMDKLINTERYRVKLGNGTMLSVKEENMIREGTKRNAKRKGRTGSTDIHLVSYIYRTSIDSENREDRAKSTFRSR